MLAFSEQGGNTVVAHVLFLAGLQDNNHMENTAFPCSVIVLLLFLPVAACTYHQNLPSGDNLQSTNTQPSPKQSDALLAITGSDSISPYEIEKYINAQNESQEEAVDFKPIWDK